MKKIKFEGKLNLKKETVSRLNDAQMNHVKGGIFWSLFNCHSGNCGTAGCPTAGCPTGSCPGRSCQGDCPTIQQTACNGHDCA
jgi:hypothetical protein